MAVLNRRQRKAPMGKHEKEVREQVPQILGRRAFQAKGEHAKALGETRPVCMRSSSWQEQPAWSEQGRLVTDEVRDKENWMVPRPAGPCKSFNLCSELDGKPLEAKDSSLA